ncbi:MAG: hexokinase [Firmicutes bacterium]|nr:hexokinase [Bacillota bacterium]
MQQLANEVRKLRAKFILSESEMIDTAKKFQRAMQAGREGKDSSLKMLPAFLAKPIGNEKGVYLAVDLGGTNVRVMIIELKGNGNYKILDRHAFPLKNSQKGHDFTSETSSAAALFGYIAERIKSMVATNSFYPLGFTFSFPSRQTAVNQAVLIKWTKEIKTPGVEGKDVSKILAGALDDKNLHQVVPRAIINDTVGTLLTASYRDPFTDIGSICGTGHNSCYVEPQSLTSGEIINMESGNFNALPFTAYDTELDKQSDIPGEQCLEKMVSGKYIGELTRIILQDFIKQNLILTNNQSDIFFSPYMIKAEDISLFLDDESSELTGIFQWLQSVCGASGALLEERITLRTIASIVVTRSAQLVAASYFGVLQHIDPRLERKHSIAIDGSLYEFTPGYAAKLKVTLNNLLKEKSELVTLKLTKDGSGVGAAVAAALGDKGQLHD